MRTTKEISHAVYTQDEIFSYSRAKAILERRVEGYSNVQKAAAEARRADYSKPPRWLVARVHAERKALRTYGDAVRELPVKPMAWGILMSRKIRAARTRVRNNKQQQGTLEYMFSLLPGGKREGMEYAAIAAKDDPKVAAVVQLWNELPAMQRLELTLDEIVSRAGIRPREFTGPVLGWMTEHYVQVSHVVAVVAAPEVVKASVKQAKRPEGIEDRKLILEHTGFKPSARSTQFSIINQLNAGQSDALGLPSFESEVIASSNRLRAAEQPALPPAPSYAVSSPDDFSAASPAPTPPYDDDGDDDDDDSAAAVDV